MPNVLSLFSGIGGLELGLERAGMTVVGQVEIDPFCQQVLAKHWPEVPRHDDVRTAVEWWRSEQRPRVDLVCGGFPCQPFSIGGLRRGASDERWLWPAFADVVRAVGPQFVLVENVGALVTDAVAWGAVLGDLHELRFDAEWSVVPACALGAPHSRERVFLVAHRADGHVAHQGARDGEANRAQVRTELGGGRRTSRRYGWVSEPAVDRVAHGVPIGLVRDQLHALGNAVVPQVAQFIGEQLMAHIEAEVAS